jgi:copper homeostasis protein
MALLEIACFTTESAILAFNAGADRIEFCKDREAGGTTPSLESLLQLKQSVTVPVFAMIRPRGGDFNYTAVEFQQMLEDIDRFKESMPDGFVFGVLTDKGKVDTVRTTALVTKASPLPCTFHRAFDECPDKMQALEDVVKCGCQAILTSGGAPNATGGQFMLSRIVNRASERIKVIVGGGVRSNNVVRLAQATKAHAYHSSAIIGNGRSTTVSVKEVRHLKANLLHPPSSTMPTTDIGQQLQRLSYMGVAGRPIRSVQPVSAVLAGKNTPVDEKLDENI